ncbi:unnamed protein product [Ilex paraguariensis]|uniref:J domain-containing protein required for chloroplast accumulation response 1 n=1 Tax=Ilex paraguariensis TaxID=185542 RepID=A0ABC8RCY0_9AQUA
MERFTQRENGLLGYSTRRSFQNRSSSSSRTLTSNSDIDFHDVFGGPPRRFSMQETRCCLSGQSEKPVFGDPIVNRSRYPSDDFYADIFRGDDAYSSPRRTDRDSFDSTPGSRVLSPSGPLPLKAEPFGSSFPAPFSLPAKLINTMDFPVFASGNGSPHMYKGSIPNGAGHPCTRSASLSRLSNQAILRKFELKNELGCNLKKDSKDADALTNSSRFHSSLYKWAGRGVLLLMPLRGGNGSKSKEKAKTLRCSSFNGRTESDGKFPTGKLRGIERLFLQHSISSDTKSSKMEGRNQVKKGNQIRVEPCQIVEGAAFYMPESESLKSVQCTFDNLPGDEREQTKPQPLPVIDKEVFVVTLEGKSEVQSLSSEFEAQGDEQITQKDEVKEEVEKMTRVPHPNVDASILVKENDGNIINSNSADMDKSNCQSLPVTSGDNLGRSTVNGKVKEFVKIFDQEALAKPIINVTRTQSCRWMGTCIYRADNVVNVCTTGMDEKSHSPKVDQTPKQSEKEHANRKITISSDNSFCQKDASSYLESLPDVSEVTIGNIDDLFQENFLITELAHDHDKLLQTGEDYDDVQVSDGKIQQWSNGKTGNIRSLLSTLQYILWPESGWKPVPLVDIIEGSALKRAYQKALLRLHPDKLQQKGAACHNIYIAEKVFDILQEAWDHFNSQGAF